MVNQKYGNTLREGNSYPTWITERRLLISYRFYYQDSESSSPMFSGSEDRKIVRKREEKSDYFVRRYKPETDKKIKNYTSVRYIVSTYKKHTIYTVFIQDG